MKKQRIPVIVGPTASGKTDAAIQLAHLLNGEIISADSMQIYRKMSIGTAKPSKQEMEGIPHHLIDCVEPDDTYSVAQFKIQALASINAILSRGCLPIIAGGTGLYINALTLPWGFDRPAGSLKIRTQLEQEYQDYGADQLYQKLVLVDPLAAQKIHPHNKKRLVRALEIYKVTGKTKSQWDHEATKVELPYDYILMGIQMERSLLYDRINQRVDQMMARGLEAEVTHLLDSGYSPSMISMEALGYKELIPSIMGERPLEESVAILKRDTRHFAKRQLTWFRRDERIHWFDAEAYPNNGAMAYAMEKYFKRTK
ncbi:MAG: tRNA (adenosine(37)-N6)-dimethylallyltransferase MiaA [Eubacteriaceae bacterium]|nr:tRNA (adenosine(37)-N6)-dimethylallyltransferase MiaA [Eubacteriaceae bacterium]